jgi:hypothetical protein
VVFRGAGLLTRLHRDGKVFFLVFLVVVKITVVDVAGAWKVVNCGVGDHRKSFTIIVTSE